MAEKYYAVHLLEEESPHESEYVDFFDSGAWVDREDGRVFYPYERIEKIEEIRESREESGQPDVQ